MLFVADQLRVEFLHVFCHMQGFTLSDCSRQFFVAVALVGDFDNLVMCKALRTSSPRSLVRSSAVSALIARVRAPVIELRTVIRD